VNLPTMLPRVLAGLLVASAILFWIGSAAERIGGGDRPSPAASGPAAPAAVAAQPSPTGAEGSEEAERVERAPQPITGQPEAGQGEAQFGVNLEAPAFRVSAVVISLALAVGIWWVPSATWLILFATAFMAAFALLDARELVFQWASGRAWIAGLAGGLLLLHAAGATLALLLLLKLRRAALASLSVPSEEA
jgi:hypothetical protein